MSGRLESDPLFVGLTRPTLILGVSILYSMLNMMICTVWFIQTANVYVVPLAVSIHLFGYIMCFKEPLFMELYMNKLGKCNQCPNKSYYGANSYGI